MHRAFIMALLVAILTGLGSPTGRAADTPTTRAIWLWDPDPMLTQAGARADFFRFLEQEKITIVWAQVGTEAGPGSGRQLKHRAEWRSWLAEAHQRHIRIEALDGDPSWALKAYHGAPLGVVEAILAFNREAGPREQLDGLHLDIEPYLLTAWRFRLARQTLLREYLDLLVTAQTRLYEFPGMQFGVDIPSWWGSTDERTGRPIADVLFQGTRKAASEHLIDRLDNVGIMNYRNFAEGGDGLIGHGTDILAYADKARHARIWMGVETSRSTPTPAWFAVGLPSADVDRILEGPTPVIGQDSRLDGFRVRLFDDGFNTHVGLSIPDADQARPSPALLTALAKIAARFSVLSTPGPADRGVVAEARALRAFRSDREWQDPAPRPIVDPQTKAEYPGFAATSVMLPKLTFAGLPAETMRRELAVAENVFATYGSYAGIAVHHY
ncbi:MAG: hypothetical protein NTY02_04410, partial [Acidobacteria bacterium]|nr:hypothetical protein [Acidobacteriota bacterium]